MTASPHDDRDSDARDPDDAPPDAARFIRHHAGEHEPDLTAGQRDLLGRVIARRILRGAKIEMIARAAATALPELDAERARHLGRDETLRARAWEDLARLRASGVTAIAVRATHDACPACRAAADLTPRPPSLRGKGESHSPARAGASDSSPRAIAGASGSPPRAGEAVGERSLPTIPIADCTHPTGCRCRYLAASDTPPALPAPPDSDNTMDAASDSSPLAGEGSGERSTRPWYRPRPPRPHGPRWTEAERAARRPARPATPKRRPRPS